MALTKRTLRAALYVRQSATRDQDNALSAPVQVEAGKKLARTDGVPWDSVRVFTDLGKSGGAGKEKRRTEYQALLAAIEAGEIDVVYSLALTRLGRSLAELLRFANLCESKGTVIVTEKEGKHDPSSPMAEAFFNMSATFAQLERSMAVQRMRDNVAERRRRGERLGPKPYVETHDLQPVIDAYVEGGTGGKAARLLNERGIAAPRAKLWTRSTVLLLMENHRPDLLPAIRQQRVRGTGSFRFFHLLRCRCGKTMTGSMHRSKYAIYRCHGASENPNHGTPVTISESKIIGRIAEELAQMTVAAKMYEGGNDDVTRRLAVLEGRKVRLNDMYEMGTITDKAEYVAKMADITDRIADLNLETRARRIAVPDLADPAIAEVNAALRAVFRWIELDDRMMPVRFEWTVPEWRAVPVPALSAVG